MLRERDEARAEVEQLRRRLAKPKLRPRPIALWLMAVWSLSIYLFSPGRLIASLPHCLIVSLPHCLVALLLRRGLAALWSHGNVV